MCRELSELVTSKSLTKMFLQSLFASKLMVSLLWSHGFIQSEAVSKVYCVPFSCSNYILFPQSMSSINTTGRMWEHKCAWCFDWRVLNLVSLEKFSSYQSLFSWQFTQYIIMPIREFRSDLNSGIWLQSVLSKGCCLGSLYYRIASLFLWEGSQRIKL